MLSSKFRLLFFGSDAFSVRILKHLLDHDICPLHVVTKSWTLLDRFAASNQLTRFVWPLNIDDIKRHEQINIGLVASFGQMIDVNTISKFEYGLFNVHPSLLPRYRGSTPIQTAVLEGISETGCTIMKIPPIAKFDVGDIIIKEPLKIKHREYALDLSDRLADLGASMAIRLLLNFEECMRHAQPQTQEGSSLARKIKPHQGEIKFKSESSDAIDRKVRAYTGSVHLYTICLGGLRIKLHEVGDPREIESLEIDHLYKRRLNDVIDTSDEIEPGAMYFHKTRRILCIKCADSKWISFEKVTPESKRKMTAIDFFNGYLTSRSPQDNKTDI